MRLLLDTHVLLWAVLRDPRLTQAQTNAISNGELYLSSASVWEIGIKRALGKLDVPDTLFDVAVDAGCRPLPISWTHAQAAAALPMHHADPFDRMLIAQALCEGLSIATSDGKFAAYGVDLVA
ncbi:type II toxin-antitoxin system VapC family toxin [Jannaschia pohangensis]|uniref:PIN domain nuclease, a component of toxin-antitoxin system (PIN domain) n=1 Tax=Jannaschia pohangensis TaxID=390807 RepID=A0A1I3UHB2_9RHOB|nr:type II toxin-antitoxin system VapC family toxin [Jannaschia pohangensis]SFJ82312.1 PIN domain nuclease, a component of toxin-antitoxin system (PIN domain) [Jannaschia pohangensis]